MPKPVSPDLGRSVQKISGNSRLETGRIAWQQRKSKRTPKKRLDFSCGFALGATTNYSIQARCQVTHPLMTGGDRGTSLAELREGQDLLKPKFKPWTPTSPHTVGHASLRILMCLWLFMLLYVYSIAVSKIHMHIQNSDGTIFKFIPKFWQAAAIQHEAREPHPTWATEALGPNWK